MRYDILSLFPEYFQGPFDVSILKKAIEKKIIEINLVNIRDFSEDKHRRVDDSPYGGGAGMVMMPGPCTRAIRSVKKDKAHVIYLTPKGNPFTAKRASELAKKDHIVMLCGHYEGIDQRVIDKEIDEELSIGPYVLSNGCLASVVVVDCVSRFIPGVLGNECSLIEESFQNEVFEAPHYTRPEEFEGECVPSVLLSGNHKKIEKWRKAREQKIIGESNESTD